MSGVELAGLARQGQEALKQYDLPPGYEPLRVQIAQRAVLAGCQFTGLPRERIRNFNLQAHFTPTQSSPAACS